MESQHPRQRAGPGQACLGCRDPSPLTRNHIEAISGKTFFFHFQNLIYASGRHTSFLCCEVERIERNHIDPLYSGIFINQGYGQKRRHSELCFLYWFHSHLLLFPRGHYQVTWYISWSPCFNCAEEVAAFLAAHPNVSLTIFASRLYYFWCPQYQEGLQRLCAAGAQVEAMSFQEFEYCWEMFVQNNGRPFKPWKDLSRNYSIHSGRLEQILRGSKKLLSEEVFCIQFNNQPRVSPPYHRRMTYLCYELKLNGLTLARDCLKNQKGSHAEIQFIEKISCMQLDETQQYQITCYITWSPCPACAGKLVEFVRGRPFLSLRILTSRLYYHWVWAFQEGLQQLCRAGVLVAVMGLQEFTDCWGSFVSRKHECFELVCWNNLERHSDRIKRRLERIWESWDVDHLINDLENLHL